MESLRCCDGELQQRGLADAGFAAQHQDIAAAILGRSQQVAEQCFLLIATSENVVMQHHGPKANSRETPEAQGAFLVRGFRSDRADP